MNFDWDAIMPALVGLLGAIAAIFGSHKRLRNILNSFCEEVMDRKNEMDGLIEELKELRDELKRQD